MIELAGSRPVRHASAEAFACVGVSRSSTCRSLRGPNLPGSKGSIEKAMSP